MDSLRRLEEIFAHFPGIGPRQARRFVYYILSRSGSTVKELADLIQEVKRATAECANCHRFFIDAGGKSSTCKICADASRDQSLLMIVARDTDYESIEKSGAYRGLYFILGGTVPILDKEPDKRIRLKVLLDHVTKNSTHIKEIILSMNLTPDGDNTAQVVTQALAKAAPKIKVSFLGRGLSTGSELEYADRDTIKNAFENRH